MNIIEEFGITTVYPFPVTKVSDLNPGQFFIWDDHLCISLNTNTYLQYDHITNCVNDLFIHPNDNVHLINKISYIPALIYDTVIKNLTHQIRRLAHQSVGELQELISDIDNFEIYSTRH